MGNRFFEPADTAESDAEILVRLGDLWIDRQSFFDRGDAAEQILAFQGTQADDVPGKGIVVIGEKERPGRGLGLVYPILR